MKVITFSRYYPKGHPKAGQPTYFVEKVWDSLGLPGQYNIYISVPEQRQDGSWHVPIAWRGEDYGSKYHTIRAGNRWKVGEQFSPRIWSGKPYRSKQVQFAPPITIVKTWKIKMVIRNGVFKIWINRRLRRWDEIRDIFSNDGLDRADFLNWFNVHPKKKKQVFDGQIICWNESINY